MKNTIVLFKGLPFNPMLKEFANFPYRAPLTLLTLASPLKKAGFTVIVIDHRISIDKAWERIHSVIDDLLYLGVSALTGYEINAGLQISGKLKKIRPEIPIVWGGWHICSLTDESLEDPRIDIAVKNIGQTIAVIIAKRLKNGNFNFSDIPGIKTKAELINKEKIAFPKRREHMDLSNVPLPAYDLIDLNFLRQESLSLLPVAVFRGIKLTGSIDYVTSFGCSNRCSYCCNPQIFGSSWSGYPVKKVIQQIKWLNMEKGFNHFNFIDAEFTMRYKRLKEFLEGIIEENIKICWNAQAAIRGILNLEKHGLMPLLTKSGCYNLAIGAESGSKKILNYINKKQTAEEIIKVGHLLNRYGISASFNCLSGLPTTEASEDLFETFNMAFELKKINPNFIFPIAFYTPLPGSVMFKDSIKAGFKPPISLEEWGEYQTSYNSIADKIPWRNSNREELVKQVVTFYLPLAIPGNIQRGTVANLKKHLKRHPLRLIIFLAHKLAYFRMNRSWFKFPFEYKLFIFYQRFFKKKQYVPGGKKAPSLD